MKGWEALKALDEGKYIRSKDFDAEVSYEHFYLKLVKGEVRSVCIKDYKCFKKGDEDSEFITVSCFYDCEWEIYEEPEEELKPCPWCRSENLQYNIVIGVPSYNNYSCLSCGSAGPKLGDDHNDARLKWNTRA